tara:strand:+ start:6173 stop:6472 length:300 start_codon:yes stop_codon:yes gene_type:complete
MNIYAMRLKTGEEVIFRTETNFDKLVESINQNILIKVDKPVTMLPVENRVTFVPWVFFARDENFTFSTQDVVLFYYPQEQIESEYRRMTSGIITSPSLA